VHGRKGRWALAALPLLALTSAAQADEDGFFCVADGYIAYQTRDWSHSEMKHTLNLVFVGRTDGMSEPASVTLEDFQVHGMKCDAQKVVIVGWDAVYEIAFSDQQPPRVVSKSPFQRSKIPATFRAESLSLMRESRQVAIPSGRSDRRYELRIDYRRVESAASLDGLIHHRNTATLVEMDATGRPLLERQVYASDREETID